jgi:DNA repair protein RadC
MPNEAPERRIPTAHDRLLETGPRTLSDAELLTVLLGPTNGSNSTRDAAQRLLDAAPLAELAWASPDELMQERGVGASRAAAIAAAFELGRRAAWSPPNRGERVLDPHCVYELLRHVAHAEREEFWIVLVDVRGRLIKTTRVAQGSLSQCPVNPRDVLREAVRSGAHGIVFAHNHPSSDPSPSSDDFSLTERLRAAAELVGVLARDHVIVSANGYYSFVEAGRWRR